MFQEERKERVRVARLYHLQQSQIVQVSGNTAGMMSQQSTFAANAPFTQPRQTDAENIEKEEPTSWTRGLSFSPKAEYSRSRIHNELGLSAKRTRLSSFPNNKDSEQVNTFAPGRSHNYIMQANIKDGDPNVFTDGQELGLYNQSPNQSSLLDLSILQQQLKGQIHPIYMDLSNIEPAQTNGHLLPEHM